MVASKILRLLVKASELRGRPALTLGGAPVSFDAVPLFQSIGLSEAAMPGASRWQLLSGNVAPETNPWDVCHRLVRGEFGADGMPAVEFAEPDLEQQWRYSDYESAGPAAASAHEAAPQDPRFPTNPNPLWYLDTLHSEVAAALASMPAAAGRRVRIAHLDTGYDPDHIACPAYLRTDLQRNFVDDDRPDDATDRIDGAPLSFTNPGHGTGTLGLLAGGDIPGLGTIGSAPFAEIVPIRVANSVVLFRNSAIAHALDYVHQLCRNPDTYVDVVSMSMGGVPSQAWADAVNALYDAGVFIVTAAGNNFGNLPTRQIVWPARFRRVVAACGVMADGKPYADLDIRLMAGNYGPPSKMDTALSAFTPNTPWARRGSHDMVDLDGAGTSSATPQVAGAAAMVIQMGLLQLNGLATPWQRVEAVRAALFGGARGVTDKDHFGRGLLDAAKAVGRGVDAGQEAQPRDEVSFPLLQLLLHGGTAVASAPATQRMLEVEAAQLSQRFPIESIVSDCDQPTPLTAKQKRDLARALAGQPDASDALRLALAHHLAQPLRPRMSGAMARLHLTHAENPGTPRPARRRLRAFAYDPLLATQLENQQINETCLHVRWEEGLKPGPVGEYLEVVDVDPASGCCYAPVDLNDPHLLSQDGLAPSEATPQFHQQMVYAVAMKTIERFEQALGRRAQWSSRLIGGKYPEFFVRRLRVYPHALREANAYYSPERKALLFGYFQAAAGNVDELLPGGLVFGCLSHDIVAHETTHALLDGLHPRFREPSNCDVLAFHEAFADIVALFQHFAVPEALKHQLSRTRGDLGQKNLLAELAQQFGQATQRHGALRNALAQPPSATDYLRATESHDRGSVLVAAVFAAFVKIYERRAAELMRLASGGTGILPDGALPIPLVDELARIAAKVAEQVLGICIRALDYCPPVDITFGDYLRALITADRDLVPEDQRLYRVAFISAFRDRGIYPGEVRSLSADSVCWEAPPLQFRNLHVIMEKMAPTWTLTSDREAAWTNSKENAKKFHAWLTDPAMVDEEEMNVLGLRRGEPDGTIGKLPGRFRRIEVHSLRPARRIRQDGTVLSDLVVEITQRWTSDECQRDFRGGCTLLIDRASNQVRYLIRKRVDNEARIVAQQRLAADDEALAYFDGVRRSGEPFAMLHHAH